MAKMVLIEKILTKTQHDIHHKYYYHSLLRFAFIFLVLVIRIRH